MSSRRVFDYKKLGMGDSAQSRRKRTIGFGMTLFGELFVSAYPLSNRLSNA